MSGPVDALIFDFGGVITRTLFETHALTERALGLSTGTLTWRGPFDPASDPLWQAMQADEITERDYWTTRAREVGTMVGQDWTEMANFVRAARGASPADAIRPEFLETVELAKRKDLRLAILSNELDLFYGADFRHRLPFMADFEVIHDATHTRVLKPDPVAYTACLTDLGLSASRCLFIDDQARNIRGAEAVGLQTVHFNVLEPAGSYAEVRRIAGIA